MAANTELSIEEKLKALFKVQVIDTKIDKLRAVRGELPMEVADLEDELAGLETRGENLEAEIAQMESAISQNKTKIVDTKANIAKYQKQLDNVKNNREYDALNKEIEIAGLEVQAAEKRIKNLQFDIEQKNESKATIITELEGRQVDLKNKKAELDTIVAETEKEEAELLTMRNKATAIIDERLLKGYTGIRANVKNGIGIAIIERDACGGCFSKIPPQRQADIRQRKKILVCEHCDRVLVDPQLAEEVSI
ncbi:MAG: C4-type zinc ribbon domain-containing protein [Bacteroidia bacterium]|nr:C4-type zinc ribbon domain-containing protein [Bacteroidia bacterium]